MAQLNTSTLSDAIKTQYLRRLLTRAVPRLVHGRWAIQARINQFGAAEVRKYGSLSAVTSALTEGTTPTEQPNPSVSTTTMTPAMYGAWIGLTDKIEMTVYDPLLSEMSGILGQQAGISADTLIRNALVAGATVDYTDDIIDRASLDYPQNEIDYADIVKQVAALEAESALPLDGEDFILVIHPHTYASLMSDPVFVNMFTEEAPDSAIRSGYVGRLLRCKIFVTANAYETADAGVGGTTDVYHALFLGWESYALAGFGNLMPDDVDNQGDNGKPLTGQVIKPVDIIVHPVGSSGASDPLNQRGTVAWKMSMATTVLNSAWVRSLEHTNVFSDD